MEALRRYESNLMNKYFLPARECIYNPDVYWQLSRLERSTLNHLRKQCR